MRYDIMMNYETLTYENSKSDSFITSTEEYELTKIAYAVDSLIKYMDKVSLKNINIITEIPTSDLEDFITFILACEEAAIKKYK